MVQTPSKNRTKPRKKQIKTKMKNDVCKIFKNLKNSLLGEDAEIWSDWQLKSFNKVIREKNHRCFQ